MHWRCSGMSRRCSQLVSARPSCSDIQKHRLSGDSRIKIENTAAEYALPIRVDCAASFRLALALGQTPLRIRVRSMTDLRQLLAGGGDALGRGTGAHARQQLCH